MNKLITELVERCATAYKACAEYMNEESLDLIERNHRQMIRKECAHRGVMFAEYVELYVEMTRGKND